MSESLSFRAHARLLTMLGEQLIKNERIALVELVKNSYDADATSVDVDFQNFSPDLSATAESAIVITDNGSGMSEGIIRTAWMNPATPTKALTKLSTPTTPRGRVLQGEKGIGRFATFKLGSQVSLVTRRADSPTESTLLVDISALDEEAGNEVGLDFYLDDIAALLDEGAPRVFDGSGESGETHGTRIEVRGLRAKWSAKLVRDAFDDLDRLQPVMWGDEGELDLRADFNVRFLRDGVDLLLGAARNEEFQAVLERAVLRVTNGEFNDEERAIRFDLNGRPVSLGIDDPEIRGLRLFRRWFLEDPEATPTPACGSFGFEFYIFDFSAAAPEKNHLDPEEKAILQGHRVYLYRDGIRVYPYGDPGDDWLQVDVIRGTQSARSMFSNDQTVGYITISQAENPQLRDKTNREGLLETGRATGDFVALIQTVLSYLRAKPYEQYSAANRRARERGLEQKRIEKHVEALRASNLLPESALDQLDELESAVQAERDLASIQVARTEQLAGVGLSVETASHDLIAAGTEALRLARHILSELKLLDLGNEPIHGIAAALVSQLEFISGRFRDVQGLFVSTRQKQSKIDVLQLVRKVRSMYASLHKEAEIEFEIVDDTGLVALTTEGAILQCVINLVDNATYWLMSSPHKPRILRVFAADDKTLVVSDNGPGVKPQDAEFVFEPFYSGKGDAGKGLGLYIARQNGLRSGFDVELATVEDMRALPGATFTVEFGDQEDRA